MPPLLGCRSVAWLAAIALLCTAASDAHEIGTSRVSVQFTRNHTYEATVVTDAVSLVDKLQSVAGSTSPAPADAATIENLFKTSEQNFRRRIKMRFDGAEVVPSISYSVVPGNGIGATAVATIRLTGNIPPGAKRFTWNYGWTFASYALTIRGADARSAATEWLEGGQDSTAFAIATPAPGLDRLQVVRRYLALGYTHILPYGLDHMLFVLGIYLLSGRARSVLTQVSAFTVAHSITLGLSMYGVVTVSPRVVEPMIALSIAYVAIENLFLSDLRAWRVGLVFAFGLLHGMGFAGALQEVGLPRSEFLTALLTFNIGVEAGQLSVIAAAFMLVGWYCSGRAWYRQRVVVPASALIACTAVYWTIVRL